MRRQLAYIVPGIVGVGGAIFILALTSAGAISGIGLAVALLGLVILTTLIAVFIRNL